MEILGWKNLLASLLWILGLAQLLATFSLIHWRAAESNKSFHQYLLKPTSRLAIASGLILFTLGLMLTVEFWLYKIGWAMLIVLSLGEAIFAWRSWSNDIE
jgi:hypothetical protein